MLNNERYLASFPTVSQAFLEMSDLRGQFYLRTFSILDGLTLKYKLAMCETQISIQALYYLVLNSRRGTKFSRLCSWSSETGILSLWHFVAK